MNSLRQRLMRASSWLETGADAEKQIFKYFQIFWRRSCIRIIALDTRQEGNDEVRGEAEQIRLCTVDRDFLNQNIEKDNKGVSRTVRSP